MQERDPRAKGQILPSLTSARWFAALAVAIHHSAGPWAHGAPLEFVATIGWLGVSFFFVLSGFVLMWTFDPATDWKSFMRARFCRIYPLHLATLLFSLGFFLVAGGVLGGYPGTPVGTLLNVFLLHGAAPGHPEIRQAWNGVSWSLSCEFCFYLAAPFLFRAMLSTRAAGLVAAAIPACFCALAALAVVATAADWRSVLDALQYHPVPRFAEFALGALAAIWVRKGLAFRSRGLALAAMLAPVAALVLLGCPGSEQPAVLNAMFAPGAVLLVVAIANRDRAGARSWTQSRLFVKLGEASFALYMTHALLLGLMGVWLRAALPEAGRSPLGGDIATLVFLVVATRLAILVHERFEIPARRAAMSYLTGRAKPTPVASGKVAPAGL